MWRLDKREESFKVKQSAAEGSSNIDRQQLATCNYIDKRSWQQVGTWIEPPRWRVGHPRTFLICSPLNICFTSDWWTKMRNSSKYGTDLRVNAFCRNSSDISSSSCLWHFLPAEIYRSSIRRNYYLQHMFARFDSGLNSGPGNWGFSLKGNAVKIK